MAKMSQESISLALGLPSTCYVHPSLDSALVPHGVLASLESHAPQTSRASDMDDDAITLALSQRRNIDKDEFVYVRLSLHRRQRDGEVVDVLREQSPGRVLEPHKLSFVDVLAYVDHSNYVNTWRDAAKRHGERRGRNEGNNNNKCYVDHDQLLLEILLRLHGNDIFVKCHAQEDESWMQKVLEKMAMVDENEASDVLGVVITKDLMIVLSRMGENEVSVQDAINFSPAFFQEEQETKRLFVLYQVIRRMWKINSRGLSTGDMTWSDVSIDDKLVVRLHPIPEANVIDVNKSRNESKGNESSLASAFEQWSMGAMSNLDYLLKLNEICGRTVDDPNHYPVLPWVHDFSESSTSSPSSEGWRDLKRSKFRLTKGEAQLDQTFISLQEMQRQEEMRGQDYAKSIQAPHHVTEVLSEITVYVYKARRTPRSTLCKVVRNRWVPAEYPWSMQRLQQWSPDECIPDFFTDSSIFRSIHDDLNDLEVPSWCNNSFDSFVKWHREALESDRVSSQLHHWIDLTFGYKLSGEAANEAKNVCLQLVDNHKDLRRHGVTQLFLVPHPPRKCTLTSTFFNSTPPRILVADRNEDQDNNDNIKQRSSSSSVSSIKTVGRSVSSVALLLPSEYDPKARVEQVEMTHSFLGAISIPQVNKSRKAGSKEAASSTSKDIISAQNASMSSTQLQKEHVARIATRDMQNLGCLIAELYYPESFVHLGRRAGLSDRFKVASSLLSSNKCLLPMNINNTLKALLIPGFSVSSSDRYPVMRESGLPPLSSFQLLQPLVSTLNFPKLFPLTTRVMNHVADLRRAHDLVPAAMQKEVEGKVSEYLVKYVASQMEGQWDKLTKDALLSYALPFFISLFTDNLTRVLAIWHLFDPLAKILGPRLVAKQLLPLTVAVYNKACCGEKHLKLYHRSMLHVLVVRLGTKVFIETVLGHIVEAAAGLRRETEETYSNDINYNSNNNEEEEEDDEEERAVSQNSSTTDEGNDAVFLMEDDNDNNNGSSANMKSLTPVAIPSCSSLSELFNSSEERSNNMASVASESLVWLMHRFGPVLTGKHIVKHLLKALGTCHSSIESLDFTQERFNDHLIRVCVNKTQGDSRSECLLKSLINASSLYGEHVILHQYLPHVYSILARCQHRRLGSRIEGDIIASLNLVHIVIPYLSDSLLMRELPDGLLSNLLFPVLQLLASRSAIFSNGHRARLVCLMRLLDIVYLIGLRIGEEMARAHLTTLCSALFSSFDKLYDHRGQLYSIDDPLASNKSNELALVLNASTAHKAYVAFYNLFGRGHLDSCILNLELIRLLCSSHDAKLTHRPVDFNVFRGNVSSESNLEDSEDRLHSLIAKEERNGGNHHLKGNWLAYWEHEIDCIESNFSLKHLRLQSFSGHSGAIRRLHVLNNENSFLSASRDKSVRVWSIRNTGDGQSSLTSQWCYNGHKKSVHSLTYLDSAQLAVSCDGNMHVWDPFVGSTLFQVDQTNRPALVAMTEMNGGVVAASNYLVHCLDVRAGPNLCMELKASNGAAGPIKLLQANEDTKLIVGHAVGNVSVIDMRTGAIINTWKGHEGELLELCMVSDTDFVTSSLDQTLSAWNLRSLENHKSALSAGSEPIHSVAQLNRDLVTVSSGNRIGHVRLSERSSLQESAFEGQLQLSRLRPEVIQGSISTIKALPLNKSLLVGMDNGLISLIC